MHNRLLKSTLDEQQRSISSQNSKEPKDKHEQVTRTCTVNYNLTCFNLILMYVGGQIFSMPFAERRG